MNIFDRALLITTTATILGGTTSSALAQKSLDNNKEIADTFINVPPKNPNNDLIVNETLDTQYPFLVNIIYASGDKKEKHYAEEIPIWFEWINISIYWVINDLLQQDDFCMTITDKITLQEVMHIEKKSGKLIIQLKQKKNIVYTVDLEHNSATTEDGKPLPLKKRNISDLLLLIHSILQ